MSFHQNIALLSFLLKGDHDAFELALRDSSGQLEAFAEFIAHHQLQLFVLSQIEGSPVRQLLPRQLLNQLKSASLVRWPRQELLTRELMHLSRRLASEGLDFILLKGPYLAARFFGGIDRREFSDLDILIRGEDLPAVERLLYGLGYTRKSTILIHRTLTTYFTHALDFAKANVMLDLHWVLSANAAHSLDYGTVWRERQPFMLRNQKVFVLSDEYEVVFSLISIFKDLERGASHLKAFVDLYFILRAVHFAFDWEQFFTNRKREKIHKISLNVLALLLDLFHCVEQFPEMATIIDRQQRLLKRISPQEQARLINASPGTLQNKLWAAHIYQCSRLHVAFWWLVSLPFRLAAYESGRYVRFKRHLRQMTNRWARRNV